MKITAFTVLLISLGACSLENTPNSKFKVSNSIEINDQEYPAVFILRSDLGGACTASFISDSLAITAAHCFGDKKPATASLFYLSGKSASETLAYAEEIYIHKDFYACNQAFVHCKHDLALVRFPKNTYTGKAMSIATRAPSADMKSSFIGYGRSMINDPKSFGIKRQGNCQLLEKSHDFLVCEGLVPNIKGTQNRSASLAGDSGGPLLIEDKIVGTVVGFLLKSMDPELTHFNLFTDLPSEDNAAFLKNPKDHLVIASNLIDDNSEPAEEKPVLCEVHSPDGSMNVRLVPNGKILGKVEQGTRFLKMEQTGEWLRVQIRIGGALLGAGGSGTATAYIHESGVKCPAK